MTPATIMLAVAGFFFCPMTVTMSVSVAGPAYERVVDAARTSAIIPDDIVDTASAACEQALCFAEALAAKLPDRVRLEPVGHPDTDSIRRVKTTPSLIVEDSPNATDALKLKLTHFGRKVVAELREALASAGGGRTVELDLRDNRGGDFERMLSIAGMLLGPIQDAVEIDHGDRFERRSLDGSATPVRRVVSVEIDKRTASAGLLLARLLTAHGGAKPVGPPVDDGPVFLKHRIPIDHDWRLVLPVADVWVVKP